MPIIIKSIGTTARNYSTITLWEADLDNTVPYDAGDDAVGECYNDSAFNEVITVNGGGTLGLNSVKLTVAVGERHDGTAGTGARLVHGTTSHDLACPTVLSGGFIHDWLEHDANQLPYSGGRLVNISDGTANPVTLNHLIVHGMNGVSVSHTGIRFVGTTNAITNRHLLNTVIYDLITTWSGFSANQRGVDNDVRKMNCYGVTTFSIKASNASATGNARGIRLQDVAGAELKNCIATNSTVAGTGAATDFEDASYTVGVASNNLSSDTTASGTGSLTSKAAADQFVSITAGSEDLHLKSGADAIDAGTDLGTTPTGVNIDIDGRDRDAEGDIWDMGADEFVAAAPIAATSPYIPIYRRRRRLAA